MSELGSIQCPIIVGRDDILELLDRAVTGTTKGRGRVLFLSGSAGLGKTRLMWAAIRKAQAAGIRIGSGSVAPQDVLVPLASIREFAAGMRGDTAWGTLSEDLLAIDGRHDGDSLGARRLIVRAVADRILEAIDRPTMIVFDDLHWTDEMSLEVIGELARHASDLPLLVVADYRGDELPAGTIHREWRARLLSQRVAEEVRLRNFTIEETGLATTLIIGGELPAAREVVEAVHERTNGIPLHIEELLAALDPDARTDGRRIREAGVPDTISDAVLARLGRLSPEAQTLARAGAVLGRCFSPDVIAGMVDQPLEQIEPTIEELIEASFLYPFDYVDQGYFDFRHQLLRDAVYDSVPISQKRRFHAQAAEFVMALEASNEIHASRHYEQAGLRPQAFDAALTAAKEASRISARHEAFELYERVIANMPPELSLAEQAQLYEGYADAAGAIERVEESRAAATKARQLYIDANRPLDAAAQLATISTLLTRDGRPRQEALAMIDQAIDEVLALPPSVERDRLQALLMSSRANDLLTLSDLGRAREEALSARAIAEAVDDRETMVECDLVIARIDIVEGRFETGLRDGMEAARRARDGGFEAVGVTGYRNIAIMAARVMDHRAADMAIHEGIQYADAIEQSHCRQNMATTAAFLEWGAGQWDAADERARHELADRGCRSGSIWALDTVGAVALGRGRTAEASRWFGESLDAGRQIGEVQFILTPLWGLAETELADGDVNGSIARCVEGIEIAEATGERALLIPFVVTGTRALLAARRPDEAERWVARARNHLTGWDPVSAPAIGHAEGLVRLAAGSLSAAREALERAVRGWEERRRVWEASWARLDLARCLIRMNRHGDASAVLAQVRTTALAVQSDPLLRQVDELARTSRGRGTIDEPWRPLTAREFEVARLVADGLTNAEIAEALTIAPKTASAHIEHILAKLGVTRRAEIAAWAANIAAVGAPAAARGGGTGAAAARR